MPSGPSLAISVRWTKMINGASTMKATQCLDKRFRVPQQPMRVSVDHLKFCRITSQ